MRERPDTTGDIVQSVENRRWCPGSSGPAATCATGRWAPLAVVLLGVSVGCSGQGAAETAAVEQAVQAFEGALATQPHEACMMLAPATLMELETSGTCPAELADLETGTPGQIQSVEVFGTHAMVETAQDTLFLARFDGDGWLVVAAGCVARVEQPYDCVVEGG